MKGRKSGYKRKHKKAKSKAKYVVFLIISVVVCILSVFAIIKSFNLFSKIEKKVTYAYNINNKVDYKVFLRKNEFIKEKYLSPGETYITGLVDYIDIDFNYLLSGTKEKNIKYNYEAIATITGEYQTSEELDNSQVWTKKYQLIPATEKQEVTNNLKVDNTIKVDFNKYNNEVTAFKKNLNLSVDATLNIKYILRANIPDEKITKVTEYNVNIPLNKQAFNITTKYNAEEYGTVYDESETAAETDYSILSIGIVFLLISSFGVYKCMSKIVVVNKKTPYETELNKLLSKYGDIIIEVVDPISTKGLSIIDVKNFNEMIDLEEELRIPILQYETIPGSESWFTVLKDKILYRYVLKDEKKD